MNRLEVPAVLAGLDVDCDYRIAEEVRALPIAAVGTGNRRRERQVDEAALLVEREVERPGVGAEPIFPAVAVPRLVADRSWLRDGIRSEEHTSELQSLRHLVCRLL